LRNVILPALILFAGAWPAAANQPNSNGITCEMVRAYVAQVGLISARAIAIAHGMTPAQARQARQCLAEESVSAR
jgi:hypothetical protein